jgi:uncharacterized repeat protein (TIGR03837 family)
MERLDCVGPHNRRVSTPPATTGPLGWDLFCRVIDNFGDVGVCWRLARTLAARGDTVRLVIDDASALAWMAPDGSPGVQVVSWHTPPRQPGDVVVEAFGCDPPPAFVATMLAAATRGQAPVWINLEYLSAEAYVERSHGLRSPQPSGMDKWFFYPGFTARTGGLLQGPTHDVVRAEPGPARGTRHVSLFCYDNPALPALLDALSAVPTELRLFPGAAQRQVAAHVATGWTPPTTLHLHDQPWLTQDAYDAVLADGDLNLVRGEDSLVRAIWSGRPFLWQIYPQHDGAHRAKLEAFLAQTSWPAEVVAAFRAWNGLLPAEAAAGALAAALAPAVVVAWRAAALAWRARLAAGPDLATSLRDFVCGRLRGRTGESP